MPKEDYIRELMKQAWLEGWLAAQEVVDFEGTPAWVHTVTPQDYEPNPYRTEER